MVSVSIHATARDGETRWFPVQDGMSVMEILRDAGFGDIQALCGGSCSCATCHVFVDEGDMDLFPPASEDENDLLDCAGSRQDNSRLSCQLSMDPVDRDVRVTVAPDD